MPTRAAPRAPTRRSHRRAPRADRPQAKPVAYVQYDGLDQPLPVVAQATLVGRPAAAAEEGDTPGATPAGAEAVPVADTVVHTVTAEDTMAGLQLRYGVTAADLRRWNNFAGDDFSVLPELVIHNPRMPSGPGQRLEQLAELQRQVPGLDGREAQAYLEIADGDFAAALAEAKADAQFGEQDRQRKVGLSISSGTD